MILRAKILCLMILWSANAFSFDLFDYQGAVSKLYGGAGITESRGGESIFYNPANLHKTRGTEFGLDVSPANLNYQFTPPDSSIGVGEIAVPFAPFVSAGVGWRAKNSKFSSGMIFTPSGADTKTTTKDFPLNLAGAFTIADLENRRNAYKLGIGWAYSFSKNFHLGLSVLYDYINNQSKVIVQGQEFISINNTNQTFIFRLGTTYRIKGLATIGIEFQPSVEASYFLTAQPLGAEQIKTFLKTYRPQVYGIGIKTDFSIAAQVFFQYRFEDWIDGTFVAKDPTQTIVADAPVEFINAHSFIGGLEYKFTRFSKLVTSFSYFGPNKGEGIMGENGQVAFYGRGVQDFESLQRYHITAGMTSRMKKRDKETYFASYIRATAASGENTPSAGFYELTVYMLGYGLYI